MDDILSVGVFERLENLRQHPQLFLERQPAAPQECFEVVAFQVLHGDIHDAIGLTRLEHGHDVRVLQPRTRLRFAIESVERGASNQVRPNGFDGDGPVERGVDGSVNLAHASATKERFDAESTDGGWQRRSCFHVDTAWYY